MRKAAKILVLFLAATVVVGLVALPFVLPPLVERVTVRTLADAGVTASTDMRLAYRWKGGPALDGSLVVSVPDTPWRVSLDFRASLFTFSARATMRETSFSERDPLIRHFLEMCPPKGVSSLSFSGSVSLSASAGWSLARPWPDWQAGLSVRDVSLDITNADGQTVSVAGLSAEPSVSGLADHVDVVPLRVRARTAAVAGFAMTNFHATVRREGARLTVDEAGAGFCGGRANVYSLHLDPVMLNAGFTLLLDEVEAGDVLRHLRGFDGTASGRLHGKLRAYVLQGGRAVRLRSAYLYSTPGETGKLRMRDTKTLTDCLDYAGLAAAARANVAEALRDLDYKVLRVDLVRLSEDNARLSLQVSGSATRAATTVPVDLKINLCGNLDQLINTGLGYSAKLKGKQP